MAGDTFEIHFSESPPDQPESVGYGNIYGTIEPIPGSEKLYQITRIDLERSDAFGEKLAGLDSSSNNQIYVSTGLSGAADNVPSHALDASGLTFRTFVYGSDTQTHAFNIHYDPNSDDGYTVTSDRGSEEIYIRSVSAFCFVSGTLIETVQGPIKVEQLQIGDRVRTATGEARPIRWLGNRLLRCGSPVDHDAWPVRVHANAFSQGAPIRDLWLSPGHSVCVDVVGEVLVPIGKLVNGATIAQIEVDEIVYWHVELETHDLLLAEGLAAESYLETAARDWFDNEEGPHFADRTIRHCRPFFQSGLLVEAIRERLTDRARALGWDDGGDPDVHLIVDGVRIDPELKDGAAYFRLPEMAREAWLRSNPFVPAVWNIPGDNRRLGLLVSGIELTNVEGSIETIALSDKRLDKGFHALECHDGKAWRWTDGFACIPLDFGMQAFRFLTINYHPTATRCWEAPSTVAHSTDSRVGVASNVVQLITERADLSIAARG